MPQPATTFATVFRLYGHTKQSHSRDLLSGLAKISPTLLHLFQLLVIVILGGLSTFLQFEFYHKHDVLPGYAWPLAVAGSLAMIAMLTLQLTGAAYWTKKAVCGAYYLFMVASTSFHVLDHTWEQLASQHNAATVPAAAQPALADPITLALTDALRMATKARAFSTMRNVADKLPTPEIVPAQQPKPKPLGFSRDEMDWIGAVILIALRALLEGAQVLCVIALKGQKRSNQEKEIVKK